MRLPALLAFAIVLWAGTSAVAQEQNSFAVGVNYNQRLSNDEDVHGNGGVGINWRIGHSKSGWGWSYGLGWFVTDLERNVAGRKVQLGELKVRPIVGGYGYTHQLSNRWFVTADLVGGFAFTSFNLHDDGIAPGAAASDAEAHVGATPIIRPELKTWYDINRRFGISVSAWYAFARPNVTISSPTSRESFRVRADTFSLSTGLVYRIF